ncbi:MAG: bifunctional folylpolyglutamate synthase/dihydrofolate synthase [Ignavibacteriaceae bacterium]|nr:bifunctional folylpolyglutamate synthase/dihydrofolate synthase [Ignavibacteriaceae bacterium]
MNIEKTLEKLYALQIFGMKFGLENIRKFLQVLGNPQNNLKCFHIAGSNGKGSTASFIASILQTAGFKTGLYTSPHFVKFNERIRINGEEIDDEYIASFYDKHESFINESGLTFFEVTTALAFSYFFEKKVKYAVIETGLGGRLDATNVLKPLAVVLTSISLEHTQYLGNTIEEIAAEKAAIIKPKAKVFLGILPEKADEIIQQKCEEVDCELFELEDYIIKRETYLELYTEELDIDRLDSPLHGYYQKYNAALATLVVNKTLGIEDLDVFDYGLKHVVENTRIQGRYEIVSENPKIIFDSAHNPEGIESFLSEFLKEKSRHKKSHLLFGVMKDKEIEVMLSKLKKAFDEFHFTDLPFERAEKKENLLTMANKFKLCSDVIENPTEFYLQFQKNKNSGECLVILGSMYLVGEIKKGLIKKST